MAAAQYLDQVQKIYLAYYGRPADPAGRNYWAEAVDKANGNLSAVINSFGNSKEATDLYAGTSPADQVNKIYLQLFNREGEFAGVNYYAQQILSGQRSASSIALDILNGAQNDDLAKINNKLAVSKLFTDAIDTTSELVAYAGNQAADSARALLKTVDQTAASVTAANVSGTLTQIVQGHVSNPGETKTLTNAIGEQVVGTSGSETFKAVLGADAANSTLHTGDVINGKEGVDTLELIVDKGVALPAGAQVSNVENIVITNGLTSLANIDAAVFAGVQKIALKNNATAVEVSNMAGLTLGVEGVAAAKVTGNFGAAATVAALELKDAKGAVDLVGASVKTVNISGNSQVETGAAQTVTVAGSAAVAATALNVNATAALALDVSAAAAAAKVTVTGAGAANLGTLHATAKTVDASANTGGVTVIGAAGLQEVTSGAGKDSVTLGAALADKGFVKTGAGDDKVILAANAVAKGATIELGAGNDSIVGTGVIDKDAIINGGEGTDTLALQLVGAANVGAFTGFEVFDVAAMTTAALDLDILTSKNTVTEITGSAALGVAAVTLSNLGAGVNFVATKDMAVANALTLTQKTAGALTVTVNADSTSTTAANDAAVKVVASNATSLKAVFDNNSGFVQTVGVAGTENNAAIDLTGTKATTLEVVSGGSNATNALTYAIGIDAATPSNGLLTSATVTGSQALTLDFTTAAVNNKLATVDASAMTGALTFDLADLANKGVLKLGSGADLIKAGGATATAADIESIVGFSKSASATDAEKIKLADKLDFTVAATVGTEATASAAVDVAKGVVTFLGTGPTTLDAAIALVDAAVTTVGGAVAFQYLNDTYIFQQNAADVVVQLTGVAGVTELGIVGAGADVFIV